jgi:hypothetical protein
MNHSLTQLKKTFESFPDFLTIPFRVEELQAETARLDSIVTYLKSLVNSTQTSQSSSITPTTEVIQEKKFFIYFNHLKLHSCRLIQQTSHSKVLTG